MNSLKRPATLALASAMLFAGCATLPPNGPSVMALPGTGKTFEQFRADDAECRNFTSYQTVNGPAAIVRNGGTDSATVGTIIGAGNGTSSLQEMQRRYDIAYIQCMYAKGNQVPVSGRMTGDLNMRGGPIPPPPAGPPPPPPPRS